MSSIYGFNAAPIMLQINKRAKEMRRKTEKMVHYTNKKTYIEIP